MCQAQMSWFSNLFETDETERPWCNVQLHQTWPIEQVLKPEDQWSCKRLTPGPGIYFNAFIHAFSPRAGADNPLETNVDVNRKPLSLCPFVASLKTISLKYDFKHILNDFIHVYNPGERAENSLGQTFEVNRKPLSLRPFVARFKQISLNSDFIQIF